MNFKKRILILILSCLFAFTIGCGSKVSTATNNAKNQTNSSVKASDSSIAKDDVSANTNDKTKNNQDKNQNKEINKNSKQDNKLTSNDNSKKIKTQKSISKSNETNKSKEKDTKKVVNENSKKEQRVSKSQNNKNNNTFTIILSEEKKGYTNSPSKKIISKIVPLDTRKNAMNYLREYFNARDRGGLIYEVDGIHNEYPYHAKNNREKKIGILGYDWFIYLNGKKTSVGANDVYMKKGDVLQLDIHRWDKREFKN